MTLNFDPGPGTENSERGNTLNRNAEHEPGRVNVEPGTVQASTSCAAGCVSSQSSHCHIGIRGISYGMEQSSTHPSVPREGWTMRRIAMPPQTGHGLESPSLATVMTRPEMDHSKRTSSREVSNRMPELRQRRLSRVHGITHDRQLVFRCYGPEFRSRNFAVVARASGTRAQSRASAIPARWRTAARRCPASEAEVKELPAGPS